MGTCLLQKIYKTTACTKSIIYAKTYKKPMQDNYKLSFVYTQSKIYEMDVKSFKNYLTYFPIYGILPEVFQLNLVLKPHCRRQQVPYYRRKDKPPAEEDLFVMEFLSPCVRIQGFFISIWNFHINLHATFYAVDKYKIWVFPGKEISPMAKVEIKQPVVDEIKAKVEGAVTVVLVDYRGLTVEQDTRLRKNLREAGCEYKVYKNTLMKRAFEGTDYAQLDSLLEGPSAIAISMEDVTAPIRILNNMAKEAEALEFKAAIVEGNFYDAEGVKALANIPSREELLARLLGSFQAPITNFARVIKQIAEKKAEGAAEA